MIFSPSFEPFEGRGKGKKNADVEERERLWLMYLGAQELKNAVQYPDEEDDSDRG